MAELGYQIAKGSLPGWGAFLDESEADPAFQWPRSIPIIDRMRKDEPQIASVLLAVLLPLMESDWQLDATGVRPDVATHVANDLGLTIKGVPWQAPLRSRGRFSWDEHLRLALLSLPYGHSVFEQVYDIDVFGLAHLRKLAWRPPRTIENFDVAIDGGLVAIRQFGRSSIAGSPGSPAQLGFAGVTIPVNRLVVYVNEREGGNWAGVSMLRPAYKMWLLKDRTLRVQALASDRNGLGLPIYTTAPPPDNGSFDEKIKWLETEIERGLSIARGARAGETAGAAIPHGATLTAQGVDGNLPDLDKQIRYYDEQIGRIALTNFLNLGGDNSTGSYALGDTFKTFFTKTLNSIARRIAATTQQHVIEDLVDANWGPSEPAPQLVPPKIGAEHPATAEGIKMLLESGAVRWDPALEAHLRAQYSLPVRPESDANSQNDVDPRAARAIAEVVQKVYLGEKALTRREMRALIRLAGAQIDPDAVATDTPQPQEA